MADETEFRPQMNGLVTEPSRILAGQSGFVEFENASCKSPGIVEPRGGFDAWWSDVSVAASAARTCYVNERNDTQWHVPTDGTDSFGARRGAAAVSFVATGSTEPNIRAGTFADRQCWTWTNALRMLDDTSNDAAAWSRLPGGPRGPTIRGKLVNNALAIAALAPDSGVAYRALILRRITTDLGERQVIGAPSDRMVLFNRIAGGVSTDVEITVNTDFCAYGDEIQIYRTTTTSTYPTDPGDEMQLVHAYRLPAPASPYVWTDKLRPTAWGGPSLYTNDSQDGLINANGRVRLATDVAFYNSMAFYAQASRGYETNNTLLSIANRDTNGTVPTFASTLYSFAITADSAVGSPTLANCNPTVANMLLWGMLTVGQQINVTGTDPETASTCYGQVVSYDSGLNQITLSNNATSAVVGRPLTVWDWFGMETAAGARYVVYPMLHTTTSGTAYGATSGVFYYLTTANASGVGQILYSTGLQDAERAFADRFGTGSYLGSRTPRMTTVSSSTYPYTTRGLVSCGWDDDPSDPAQHDFLEGEFAFVSSKPAAWSSFVGATYADTTGQFAAQSGGIATLAWSKFQQPEHIPVLNYNVIGDAGKPIVRIVATEDRLWIFKADGLWCCYGDTPDSLIFQQVSSTLRMPSKIVAGVETFDSSPWVARIGNAVYAWTTRGIFSVSTAGIERVDSAIESDIRARTPFQSSAVVTRPFASAGIISSIVVFGSTSSEPFGNSWYALHTESGTWSKWLTSLADVTSFEDWITGSGESDVGTLLLGTTYGITTVTDNAADYQADTANGRPYAFSDRISGEVGTNPDIALSATVGAFSVATFTGDFLLVEGSIVMQSGNPYMVLSIVYTSIGPTTADVTFDREGLVDGAATMDYYPITQTITYAATTSGSPSTDKVFKKAYFSFQSLRGGTRFRDRYRVRGKEAAGAWLTEQYPDPESTTTLADPLFEAEVEISRDVPTDQTRGTGLEVTLELNQAAVYQAIDGLSVTFRPSSTKIGGRS